MKLHLASCCLLVFEVSFFVLADDHVKQYCIVGGGPAGIQLGHFFFHAKRDYVIYEKNPIPGSFFAKFPIHRALISLNRRQVRQERSKEFALRHDWNSLLDVRPNETMARPVTERSKALFPHADVIVEYLKDFAAEQQDYIRYNTAVKNISKDEASNIFSLTIEDQNALGSTELVKCRYVIVATGLWTPNTPNWAVDGAKYLDNYEDLPETGEFFEGKTVTVLGMGNAAMETATAVLPYAAETSVFARPRPLPQGGRGIRFAQQTHYVGDIRAGRLQILDNYFLKSLDSMQAEFFAQKARLLIIPCLGGKKCFWRVSREDCADDLCNSTYLRGGQRLNYLLTTLEFTSGGWLEKKVHELIRQHFSRGEAELQEIEDDGHVEGSEGWRISPLSDLSDAVNEMNASNFTAAGINQDVFLQDSYMLLHVNSEVLYKNQKLMDELAVLMPRYNHDVCCRSHVDHFIRCFGWHMDTSIFDSSVLPNTTHKGKYPALTSAYQVQNVSGMYFAGTLTHGLDFRHSAGGFIHGFRYTAKVLFHLLEEKSFGVPFPSAAVVPLGSFEVDSEVGEVSLEAPLEVPLDFGEVPLEVVKRGHAEILARLYRRINEASGPYQMFQALGDMIVFKDDSQGKKTSLYYEDVPLVNFVERFKDHPRLIFLFKYGDGFYGPKVLAEDRVGSDNAANAHNSNFLHPKINFYPAGSMSSTMSHYMSEDIFTQWTSTQQYAPFAHFMARVVATVLGDPSNKDFLDSIRGEEPPPQSGFDSGVDHLDLKLDNQCSCTKETCVDKCTM